MLSTPSTYGLRLYPNGIMAPQSGPCLGYAVNVYEAERYLREHVRNGGNHSDVVEVYTKDPKIRPKDSLPTDEDGYTVFAFRLRFRPSRLRKAKGFVLVKEKDEHSERDKLLNRAEQIGKEWGTAAAGWHFGPEISREQYEATLKGIEDIDPAIVDTFPRWNHNAGENGALDLAKQLDSEGFDIGFDLADIEEGYDHTAMYESFTFESVMSYCETGFRDAVADEIGRTCRYQLQDD